MAAAILKAGWTKPSRILFASEFPANERVFASALAQAAQSGASLVILHIYQHPGLGSSHAAHSFDKPGEIANLTNGFVRDLSQCFESLVDRANAIGVHCAVVTRHGQAETEILKFLHEKSFDRLIIGAHTPGPVGKVLVGSVAESLIRSAGIPVNVVGPFVEGAYRSSSTRTILCSLNSHPSSTMVACFAADLAARHDAHLVLQQVVPPQEADEILGEQTLGQLDAELHNMVPARLHSKLSVRTRAVIGDPTEELLYQGRVLHANLIVMGAQGASHFAAVSRAGVIYKVLAYSRCPVLTLSPVVLAGCGIGPRVAHIPEVNYLAGVV